MFLFENPFTPEEYLIINNLNEHAWNELNLACIESVERIDILRTDLKVKKIRQTPPQVAININNLSLPAINIPNLPQGSSLDQLQSFFEQYINRVLPAVINGAAVNVAEELIKTFPVGGFERIEYNKKWRME